MSNRKKLTPRRNAAKRLTMAEELELVIGPGPRSVARGRSAFLDDDHRRRAWVAHRDRLLEAHRNCWAQHEYDPPDAAAWAVRRDRILENHPGAWPHREYDDQDAVD